MPWSLQEILGNADELADQFEDFDPAQAEVVPMSLYLLERAFRAQVTSERHFVEALAAARADGASWDRIGDTLGITGDAAQALFGHPVDRPEPVDR